MCSNNSYFQDFYVWVCFFFYGSVLLSFILTFYQSPLHEVRNYLFHCLLSKTTGRKLEGLKDVLVPMYAAKSDVESDFWNECIWNCVMC